MPLTSAQSRRLVVAFVAAVLALSALATVLILRGWADEDLQEQVSDQENERRQSMPRLGD